MPAPTRNRRRWRLVFLLPLFALPLLLLPGCAYIAQAARGHLELMAGAMPIDKAIKRGDFNETELARLAELPAIRAFGHDVVGLSASKNYTTINPEFNQVVWNVSGCAEDRFVSHSFAYPVVGKLPYIGFFDRAQADAERADLDALGWETHVRSSGAYSTLGWFKDPLWRSMLAWDIEQLSNTVLHELAHATVWLRGEGRFNESFAAFVGDEASERYLRAAQDERPELWQTFLDRKHDQALYRVFMHRLYKRLDALYRAGLPREETLRQKALLIAQARLDYQEEDWRLGGYRRLMNPERTVNNAKLVQFRVYNTGLSVFDEALGRFDGDLAAFIEAARQLPRLKRRGGRDWDPYEAVGQLRPEKASPESKSP